MSKIVGYSNTHIEGNKLFVGPITEGFIKKNKKGCVSAIETSMKIRSMFSDFFDVDTIQHLRYKNINGYLILASRKDRNPSLKFNTAVSYENKLLWEEFREDYLNLYINSDMDFTKFASSTEFVFIKHCEYYEIQIITKSSKNNNLLKDDMLLELYNVISKEDELINLKDNENRLFDVNIESSNARDQVLQAQFRQTLIDEAYQKGLKGCWLCGKEVISLLEAAHIYDFHDGGSFDVNNGLLLCRNHHAQFDNGYIKIDPNNGKVYYTGDIETINQIHEDIELNQLVLNNERKENLLRKH